MDLSQPAINLPENLLTSPEDSSVIAAHMNAYTKWLLENNMLVSQQSLDQFAQLSQPASMPPPPIGNVPMGYGCPRNSGMSQQIAQHQPKNDGGLSRNLHDISMDLFKRGRFRNGGAASIYPEYFVNY